MSKEFEIPLADEEGPSESKRLELLLDPEGWAGQRAILFDPERAEEAWLKVDASILRTTTEAR